MTFAGSFMFFGSILCHCIYGCMFCVLLFNFVDYVFLILRLCVLFDMYILFCVLYHCVVQCIFCVNVYCTTATGCQPNYS
jgi:hypothetical protein